MLIHVNDTYLVICLSIANQGVQTTAYMALDVILDVKIVIAIYLTEPVLHADKDGKGTRVKRVQIHDHLNQLIQLVNFDHLLSIYFFQFIWRYIFSLSNHFRPSVVVS